jgi:hypothetical protein
VGYKICLRYLPSGPISLDSHAEELAEAFAAEGGVEVAEGTPPGSEEGGGTAGRSLLRTKIQFHAAPRATAPGITE